MEDYGAKLTRMAEETRKRQRQNGDSNKSISFDALSLSLSNQAKSPELQGSAQGSERQNDPERHVADNENVAVDRDSMALHFNTTREYVDYILDAGSLDEVTKAYMIATAQYDPEDVRAAMSKPVLTNPDRLAQETQLAYMREKSLLEARRLIAGESFRGSEEVSWDALDSERVHYLVDTLIPKEGIVFLFGRKNLGKTYAWIDMALSMQYGMPWLGKATTPTKVLIVVGEGLNTIKPRIRAWCDHHGQDVESLRDRLFFVRGGNLNADVSIERIREVAEREDVGLIIFDTWATTHGGQSEDDGATNSITIERAEKIKPDATLMFMHHPRKAEQDTNHPVMRGSGALDGRADVVMSIWEDKAFAPSTGEKESWLAISTDNDHGGKNRTAQVETFRGLYLSEEVDQAVMVQIESETLPKEARRVAELLRNPMTAEQFMVPLKKSKRTAERYLKVAVEQGVAVARKVDSKAPAIYELTQETRVNWGRAMEVAK